MQQRSDDEVAPMDPVAVTLAVWLGLIVCVTGLIRLSEHAAAQAALVQMQGVSTQVDGRPAPSDADLRALSLRLTAFGG